MSTATQEAPPRRRLEFAVDVPCPECRGKGKLRSRFNPRTGRWFAPACDYCRGRGLVRPRD